MRDMGTERYKELMISRSHHIGHNGLILYETKIFVFSLFFFLTDKGIQPKIFGDPWPVRKHGAPMIGGKDWIQQRVSKLGHMGIRRSLGRNSLLGLHQAPLRE